MPWRAAFFATMRQARLRRSAMLRNSLARNSFGPAKSETTTRLARGSNVAAVLYDSKNRIVSAIAFQRTVIAVSFEAKPFAKGSSKETTHRAPNAADSAIASKHDRSF